MKRLSIAEFLVNDLTYTINYNFKILKIDKICNNIVDLFKMEAFCILLSKTIICKQNYSSLTVSLFS